MTDFRRLSDKVWASPQISPEDVALAAERGFTAIVNNRPDGEAADQPDGATIAEVARENGLAYAAIPIGQAGFGEAQVHEMASVLGEAEGPVLAYCRSGTRSTLLWALAEAHAGQDPDSISRAAAEAGYDVRPVRPVMDMLAKAARP